MDAARLKIGVFDSGVGGAGVARTIAKSLSAYDILLREDKQNLPYGTKTPELLLTLVLPILQEMVAAGCRIIVIACNTVSTTIIDELQARISVPLIPTIPMVQAAAEQTKSNVIAVCATPTTLMSSTYAQLKAEHTQGIVVLEPDCSDWSLLIETDQMDEQKLTLEIEAVLAEGADIIVLACTHYHWIEADILAIAKGRAIVLQPEQTIVAELKRQLVNM